MSCLYRADEAAQVSPACLVSSKVVPSIHNDWSVPTTAPTPELRVVVPDFPIWKYTLAVKLVEEAMRKVLSVE